MRASTAVSRTPPGFRRSRKSRREVPMSMSESRLHQLSALGQSVWIDFLSREMLQTGELERLMRDDAVVGITSNPTIFQKAISQGGLYDEQIRASLGQVDDPKEIFWRLAEKDVGDACDVLRPIWDEGQGQDGYVSIEVDPNLAGDTEGTIAEARRLHAEIDRPNLFVKIPATKEGLPAIEEMIASGKNINVTLIFSLERYAEVVEAYIRGLERLVESGGDPSQVASVASFFVSRVDTETDKRLDELGGHDELKGKLAIANAKLAYQRYKELFSGERWEALAAKGATTQRCLWASTSTKNPVYRDVMYVEELIGPATVNTMPEETIQAFQDHGEVALTLEQGVDEARRLFDQLAEAGVDYDDVVRVLEEEGVQKFADSFARARRVVRYDLRGFGRSPLRPGRYSPPADLIALLDELALGPATLVGVSMGGGLSLQVAVARPELVSALVLVGSGVRGHDWSDYLTQAWAEEEAAVERGDLDAAVEVNLRTWVDGPHRSPDEVDPEIRRKVGEMQRRALGLYVEGGADVQEEALVLDIGERLGEISVPTLVLAGELDVR